MNFLFTYSRIFLVGVMAFLPLWMTAQCVWTNVHTTDKFCAPEDSVYISLFPYGGTAPYTYLWSTGVNLRLQTHIYQSGLLYSEFHLDHKVYHL